MFACSRAVINPMIDAGFGRIVCVSSIAAPMGQMGGTAYSAAKAAVSGFVASLSKEAGRFGVRVNSVLYGNAPHPSRTPDRQAELDTWSHLGRVGRPGEFANAVMFLVSEESSYITGTTLEVDGGIMRMALL
jgi:NAD(P)-dependent dehydrogenase (short-subunit alcohol dehydrogenase family)